MLNGIFIYIFFFLQILFFLVSVEKVIFKQTRDNLGLSDLQLGRNKLVRLCRMNKTNLSSRKKSKKVFA